MSDYKTKLFVVTGLLLSICSANIAEHSRTFSFAVTYNSSSLLASALPRIYNQIYNQTVPVYPPVGTLTAQSQNTPPPSNSGSSPSDRDETLMKDWIPFLQSLIWPLFLAILLLSTRKWIGDILVLAKERIKEGGEMSIGPSGLALGSAPKYKNISDETAKNLLESVRSKSDVSEGSKQYFSPYLEQSIYLVHEARYWRQAGPSYDRRNFFNVEVRLDADTSYLLDQIEKVVYFRHPSFKETTILEVTERESNYSMTIQVWGQFNLKAEVYFKAVEKPLILYRYLNF